MFGKLEASAGINKTGIGLGLNICMKIIKALGGIIYLDENNDRIGTAFTFTVKCSSEIKEAAIN
jgi:K+-sensing histidine kinase KdpD